jgi:hypothetical protein
MTYFPILAQGEESVETANLVNLPNRDFDTKVSEKVLSQLTNTKVNHK